MKCRAVDQFLEHGVLYLSCYEVNIVQLCSTIHKYCYVWAILHNVEVYILEHEYHILTLILSKNVLL